MLENQTDTASERQTRQSYLDHPVFLCGHRKTGTTMLINLFDGTQQAVVYPDDSGFFYLYYPRFDGEGYSLEEKKTRLADVIAGTNLKAVIDEARCTDEQRKDLHTRNQHYQDLLKNYSGSASTEKLLRHFIESYRQSFVPEDAQPRIWMEKTTSTEIYALEMAELFPHAKFIHLIRDPRDNWASLQSGWEKRYKDFNDDLRRLKQSLLERGKLGMDMARANLSTLGKDRYKIVKFEDFTGEPESHMRELCAFIGIDFDPRMLVPSTFGYPWTGNNFEGKSFRGASQANVNRWRDRISDEDAALIEFHFRDIMEPFGYEVQFDTKTQQQAATKHYKWFNFSTPYSAK